MVLEELKSILKGKPYSLYVVSLEAKNFKKMLPLNKENFLQIIEKYSRNSTIFIFGAPSILNNIEKFREKLEVNLFLKPRLGVAKITKDLKNQLLTYLACTLP